MAITKADMIDNFLRELKRRGFQTLRSWNCEDYIDLAKTALVPDFAKIHNTLKSSIPFFENSPIELTTLAFRFRHAPTLIKWIAEADPSDYFFRSIIVGEIDAHNETQVEKFRELYRELGYKHRYSAKDKEIYKIYEELHRKLNSSRKTNVIEFLRKAIERRERSGIKIARSADSLRRNYDRIKKKLNINKKSWPTAEFTKFFAFISTFYLEITDSENSLQLFDNSRNRNKNVQINHRSFYLSIGKEDLRYGQMWSSCLDIFSADDVLELEKYETACQEQKKSIKKEQMEELSAQNNLNAIRYLWKNTRENHEKNFCAMRLAIAGDHEAREACDWKTVFPDDIKLGIITDKKQKKNYIPRLKLLRNINIGPQKRFPRGSVVKSIRFSFYASQLPQWQEHYVRSRAKEIDPQINKTERFFEIKNPSIYDLNALMSKTKSNCINWVNLVFAQDSLVYGQKMPSIPHTVNEEES